MNVVSLIRAQNLRNVLRFNVRYFASSEGINVNEAAPSEKEIDIAGENEDEIERIRNKSKLYTREYRKMHKIPPPLSEDEKHVFPLDHLRTLYGRYGSASDVNVGMLWPSKEEMELLKEKESVEFPDSIPQMLENARLQKQAEEDEINERQADLARKVAKLEGWKKEVKDRFDTQQRIAQEAKEKKERMMEEVRQMFGFRIDPKDERFKEALEKKEQEDKRAAKAAKKLKKQQKMIEQIKKLSQQGSDKLEGDDTSSKEGNEKLEGDTTSSKE